MRFLTKIMYSFIWDYVPPLYIPFYENLVSQNIQSQFSPESKINSIRPLVPEILHSEVKKCHFWLKFTKRGRKIRSQSVENQRFFYTLKAYLTSGEAKGEAAIS